MHHRSAARRVRYASRFVFVAHAALSISRGAYTKVSNDARRTFGGLTRLAHHDGL